MDDIKKSLLYYSKYFARRAINSCFNNILFNNVVVFLQFEKKLKKYYNPYIKFIPDRKKTLQETAGFSVRPEINEVLEQLHAKLKETSVRYFPAGGNILDIGCGPGLYLKDFDERYKLSAIDISNEMLKIAAREIPRAKYYHGDFIEIALQEKYSLIYSIGMLIYVARNDLEKYFEKIYQSLHMEGILFLSYPHAISKMDLYYPDLSYIQYSPALIEKIALERFIIIEHRHGFDGRIIGKYDTRPYKSLNPATSRTYKNSYILIARKKI